MKLSQYQISLLRQNLENINNLIKQNQEQLKTVQNPVCKQLLQQQIKCLKSNASYIKISIESGQIQNVN